MSHVQQVPLRVRGYECTPDRTVGLPAVLSYMEHCRWEWIMRPELGLCDGLHTGHFFVVHRQTVALARSFGIGTPLTVRAALRSVGRVQCDVEQDVVRDDGVLLARARITAVWLGPSGAMARILELTRAGVTDEPLPCTAAPDSEGRAGSYLAPAEIGYAPVLERKVTPEIPDDASETVTRRWGWPEAPTRDYGSDPPQQRV